MTKKRNVLYFFGTLVVLLLLFQLVYAGYWAEVPLDPDVDPECNGLYHVMCAEKDFSGSKYHPLTRNISYTNHSGTEKTGLFCAIYDQGDNTCAFELRDGTQPGVNIEDLDDLKEFIGLCQESQGIRTYNGYSNFYDENCNGDEMFEMNQYGRLNTTRYMENNVTYDVSNRNSNIDYFDIITDGIGGVISGTIADTNGELVKDANVTLYFDNPRGNFIPYRSYLTNEDGFYTTRNNVNIETYFRNVTTDLIPRTDYIIIVKHPEYLDSIIEVELAVEGIPLVDYNLTEDGNYPWVDINITMNPVNLCESDCTFTGSNLCKKACHGINGCLFQEAEGENLGDYLDGMPSGITVQQEINGNVYEIFTCEGDAISTERIEVSSTKGPDCPPDQEVWKTTQLVRMDGQVVKMVVTLCQ